MAEVLDLTLSDNADDTDSPPQYTSHSATIVSVKNESQSRSRRSIPVPRFNNDQRDVTIVNGKGFWKSWTRSFKTTLLKLLDLIDNAVDGATTTVQEDISEFTGRVHIYPDIYEQSKTNRRGKKYTSTTGLCIRNNSPRKIVPLSEALVVHNTTKVGAGDIGENGVGLKQACAALCDLSFVLVKNGSNANVELGIVAKSLQREEGPYLPAFQFSNETEEGQPPLREQMASLFSQTKHEDVAQCIAQFGADVSGGDLSLAAGIDGLCKHFDEICHDFYGNDHVFEVLLNKIRHDQEEGLGRRALDAQQKITVNQLIKDLQMEIPKTYLHIPDSLQFIVGKQELTFKYWQERLVEFSTFTVTVGASLPWQQNFEVSDEHPDSYDLRLFMGFDRHRITDPDVDTDTGEKKENKNASLYFYSRHSGRQIKSIPDARHILGLSSSSTNYASALTIIIDDVGGNLPLDPTKQDISFGLENKGAIHEENLFAWVGAVTKFYYNAHLKKYKGLKKVLSAKVSHYVDSKLPKEPVTYDKSDFTTYELIFEQYRNTIRVDIKSREISGLDTYFRLTSDFSTDTTKGEQKKRSRNSSQKKQPQKESGKRQLPSDAEKTAKQLSPQPVSYREESDHDSGEESNVHKAKRSRSQPDSRREEKDPDSGEVRNVKMEASTMKNEFDNNSGCIDLCETSDEEGDGSISAAGSDLLPAENSHVSEETQSHDAPEEEPQNDKSAASESPSTETSKIQELEQVIDQIRGESNESKSKIQSLDNENKALKEELERKETLIAVLKRRLGA